jgi:hypothetical protein
MEVPGVSGTPQGAVGIEVAVTGAQLGYGAMGLQQDLVVCGVSVGVAGSAALGDAAPTPGSLSIMSPGVFGLYLSCSPGSLPLPINWWWLDDEAESACS